jgi:hypothetical protein
LRRSSFGVPAFDGAVRLRPAVNVFTLLQRSSFRSCRVAYACIRRATARHDQSQPKRYLIMKSFHKVTFIALLLAAFAMTSVYAKQGATDPIPGTSKGTVNSGGGSGGGGGGGGSTTTTTTTIVLPPAPPPAPFVPVTLTFSPVSQVNGVDPVCTGSYHIDPYYPTLSLMTVNVETSSVNAPDGTVLYVSVKGTGGTLYPFTSNTIYLLGGYGLSTYSVYITPGTTITSVDITDASGQIIASGK